MALDIFAVEPHGADPNRSNAPARPVLSGGFTELLMSALANKGLAGTILIPGLEIARSLGTEPGPDATPEPKALTRAAAQADAADPVSEEPAPDDITDDIDDVDGDDAETQDAAPGDADAAAEGAGHDTAEATVADGPRVPAALAGAPHGGVAEAASLASLLSQVGANEAAISAVADVMPAAGAAPVHAAAQATSAVADVMPAAGAAPVHAAAQAISAVVVQQAQSGARAATVLQALQSAPTAHAAVAGMNTGQSLPNTSVTQSAPGLTSRPSAALAPGAALASMATDTAGHASAVSPATSHGGPAATMPQADTQSAAHAPTHKTMPATASGEPRVPHATAGTTGIAAPTAGFNGGVSLTAGAGSDNASLRADRPDLVPVGFQQAAAKGQAQAQSTPAGTAAARADAVIAPATPAAPGPTQLAAAAPRPAAQTVLPLGGSEAGSGAHNGHAGTTFNPLLQRAGAHTAATAKPQIQTPLPPNTTAADQIAINIQRAATAGMDRIQIRMVPAELGRVDVRLEMSRGQRIKAVIMAEKQDTLDLLQRDARQLERALQQAGLQTDRDSLEFTLRDGNSGAATAQNDRTGDDTDTAGEESDIAGDLAPADTAIAQIVTDDHIDVHV